MCGFLLATASVDIPDSRWRSSLDSLACRGPDDYREWRSQGQCAGHRRLAVIGSGSNGQQPISNSDHLLVFNGEIYNYKELALELGVAATSDTEVLFEIVQRDLLEWLPRVRGMYAFVHIDIRAGVIEAARDPFGIKPLYSSRTASGGIAFGSTAASLALLLDGRQPNPVGIASFLGWGFIPPHHSAFAKVNKVPPGVVQTWASHDHKYVPLSERTPVIGDWPRMPVEKAIENSVAAHLIADVPVGVLLSGGLDSTLIAAIASESAPDLRTYSLTNPLNPNMDEGELARHNAALIGSTHTEVQVSPKLLAKQLEAIIRTSGEPFGDPAYLPLALLCREVSQDIKVALAGEGADEMFGGYRRYDIERNFETRLFRKVLLPAARKLRLGTFNAPNLGSVRRILQASVSGSTWERHAVLTNASWPAVARFLPEFSARAVEQSQQTWASVLGDQWVSHLPAYQAFDLRVWLPNTYLEKSDRASMLNGLEIRTPYLDPLVARAARSEPIQDSSKRLLRQALFERLPGVRLPKRKKGLAVDLASLTPELNEPLHFILYSRESILRNMGLSNSRGLDDESHRQASLRFRLAVLGSWQQTWL